MHSLVRFFFFLRSEASLIPFRVVACLFGSPVLIGTNDSFQRDFSCRLALPLLELTYGIPFEVTWWGAHVSVDTSMRRLQRLLEIVLDGSFFKPVPAEVEAFLLDLTFFQRILDPIRAAKFWGGGPQRYEQLVQALNMRTRLKELRLRLRAPGKMSSPPGKKQQQSLDEHPVNRLVDGTVLRLLKQVPAKAWSQGRDVASKGSKGGGKNGDANPEDFLVELFYQLREHEQLHLMSDQATHSLLPLDKAHGTHWFVDPRASSADKIFVVSTTSP